MYRGGAEQKIRKYLIDNNYVDAVIQLPTDLFFGTNIATCILVIKKNKPDNKVLFIDATNEFVRGSAKNKLNDGHMQKILDCYSKRYVEAHFSYLAAHQEIADKDYNISVGAYVEPEDTLEVINIKELNAEIEKIVTRQSELRMQIDAIVADLKGGCCMSRIDDLIKKHCPDGVEFKELGECIEKNTGGGTPSKAISKYWNGDIPWASVGDLTIPGNYISSTRNFITKEGLKSSSSNLIKRGNVVVAVKISPGTMKIASTDIAINQDIRGLTLKRFITAEFLTYYFQTMDIIGNGAIVKSITRRTLERIKIPAPPLPVQQEIVAILDRFTRLEAELEAELEARRKQYAYYRNSLLSLNEIGENLERERCFVQWRTLGEVAMYSDTRIEASAINAENYVGVDNLLQNRAGKTDSSYLPISGRLTRYERDDILLGNIRPYLKKIWHSDRHGGTNGDVLVVRIKKAEKENILPRYLYQILADDNFFQYAMKTAKGAKMPRGNKPMIMKYQLALPSLEEQARIVAILDKFDALVNDISSGLPAEIAARRKQYEYYRNQLLTFQEAA